MKSINLNKLAINHASESKRASEVIPKKEPKSEQKDILSKQASKNEIKSVFVVNPVGTVSSQRDSYTYLESYRAKKRGSKIQDSQPQAQSKTKEQ